MTAGSRRWRLGFAGFGSVNRALAKLLVERRAEIERRYGLSYVVTMVSSARRGAHIEARGLDIERALEHGWEGGMTTPAAIAKAPIDLLFEGTPLDPKRGEPATSHVRAALSRGTSVVSANKGPVAFAYRELAGLASRKNAGFRFESAVADCVPIFNMTEVGVPVGRIISFEGVLNATSNIVLQAVAAGGSASGAVEELRRSGIAEADPSHDLDGWDQAVKAVILAVVLLGREVRPDQVERTPLSAVDRDWLRSETQTGRAVRLAASAGADGPLRVGPVAFEPGSFLGSLRGGSLGITLVTELAGTIQVAGLESGVEETAYGMLADMIAIHQGRRIVRSPILGPATPAAGPGRRAIIRRPGGRGSKR